MIKSFRHKGLEKLHKDGDTSAVQAEHVERLRRLLASLEEAQEPDDMLRPGNRLYLMKKGKHAGFWAVNVSGNWWVIFRFVGSDVELVS
ncbi:type II toxin-antitoxin system RelE/ParE family toxin [Pseudomonas sp. LS1212]|uniref:type II toxin-antitoxin system RelE/ParE family toxin n=1 Tax=Pseudomonas sp. LS1212 TaxID=2972478 RepID=UPI0028527E42|nr:type II toxin-antitoxin system RelE/ParE family toxin [Pseudomonas sp. LS1212]